MLILTKYRNVLFLSGSQTCNLLLRVICKHHLNHFPNIKQDLDNVYLKFGK